MMYLVTCVLIYGWESVGGLGQCMGMCIRIVVCSVYQSANFIRVSLQCIIFTIAALYESLLLSSWYLEELCKISCYLQLMICSRHDQMKQFGLVSNLVIWSPRSLVFSLRLPIVEKRRYNLALLQLPYGEKGAQRPKDQ